MRAPTGERGPAARRVRTGRTVRTARSGAPASGTGAFCSTRRVRRSSCSARAACTGGGTTLGSGSAVARSASRTCPSRGTRRRVDGRPDSLARRGRILPSGGAAAERTRAHAPEAQVRQPDPVHRHHPSPLTPLADTRGYPGYGRASHHAQTTMVWPSRVLTRTTICTLAGKGHRAERRVRCGERILTGRAAPSGGDHANIGAKCQVRCPR